ncbi:MAG TPA: hypothetical protein VNK95_22620 [Caldilineaceae bacterium]|nr:hypothetical protein [Caldilineaceae bacterium]
MSTNNLKRAIEQLMAEFSTEESYQPPIRHIIQTLLIWPPDLFAVTSLLFKQTGAYVFSVLPLETWPDEQWEQRLEEARRQWYEWILDPARRWEGRETLHRFVAALSDERLEQVSITDICELVDAPVEFGALPAGAEAPFPPDHPAYRKWLAWSVCKALLNLHALTDEICRGFGTPSGNQWTRSSDLSAGDLKPIHCIANMLLAYTGSLSQMPPYQGVVLPKMRTPSLGITLRSLSHHLTFHCTEVKVAWRTLPWVDIDENTLNLLIVPWPYRIEATWFRPSSSTTNRKSKEQTRYFEYTGGGAANRFPVDELLAMLAEAERSVHRIHLIVFPEQALSEEERDEILDALAKRAGLSGRLDRTRVPMLLAGVRLRDPEPQGSHSPSGTNKVVLSTFFAGKWYQLEQNKHHRWRLSDSQIWQYGIGGALSANRSWWEATHIPRRKLAVLAPNSWFSLCPLICEDLARQEPISDLLRGIGPTLLIAVLLDGPQIRERWAGRYASVLADDPGSSVLSVSALGLTRRARSADGRAGSSQVALWKDGERGWCDVNVDGERGGVVLTVDARWRTEFTADGRADDTNGAIFVMSGVTPIAPTPGREAPAPEARAPEQVEDEPKPKASPDDLLEITLFSFFVDAVIDCDERQLERIDVLRRWLLGETDEHPAFANLRPLQKRLAQQAARLFPNKEGYYVTKPEEGRPSIDNLIPFLAWFCDLIERIKQDKSCGGSSEFSRLFAYTEAILGEAEQRDAFIAAILHDGDPFARLREQGYDLPPFIPPDTVIRAEDRHIRARIAIYSCLAILWAIHRRLAILRRFGELTREEIRLLNRVETLLQKDYDNIWAEAIAQASGLAVA